MKSIMQEASSVTKAIQQAWQAAGHPKDFSVKIFEVEKKNFFGFTTQSAKVGIFFNEHDSFKHDRASDQKAKQRRPVEQQFKRQPQQYQQQPHAQSQHQQQPQQPFARREQERHERPKVAVEHTQPKETVSPQSVWTPEMIAKATEWTNGTLKAMNLENTPFSVTTDHYQLNLIFGKPVIEDIEKERNLFRSLSFLMLCSLKRNFKRPMRGFKVIFARA